MERRVDWFDIDGNEGWRGVLRYKVRSIRTVSVRHSSIYDVKIVMGRTVEAMNWGLLRDILRIRKLVDEY